MRRILVTGGNGKIGKVIISESNLKNTQFIVLTRKLYAQSNCKNVTFINFDFRSETFDNRLWNANEILHIAGATHEKNKTKYFEVNCNLTEQLVKLAEKNNIRHFVYISTQAVGKKGGAYSHSKEIAENIIKESALKWTIIRPSEIYGENMSSSITSLCKLINKSKFIPIIGKGDYTINPLHINDFSNFLKKILDCKSQKCIRKSYTLAGPEPIKFKNFCHNYIKISGNKKYIVHLPISLCKFFLFILTKFTNIQIVYDQIDRLIMKKENDIRQAELDYSFRPKSFNYSK